MPPHCATRKRAGRRTARARPTHIHMNHGSPGLTLYCDLRETTADTPCRRCAGRTGGHTTTHTAPDTAPIPSSLHEQLSPADSASDPAAHAVAAVSSSSCMAARLFW
mmetsp:Transcript_47101/g.138950  ORF Transcript_47101/g.138950 Transcript_47101/m.138950 type:complete len:107 (+) Transcript_47101:338-658(+)|eukprot:6506128-Prymnesium_polylepis.1